MEFSLNFVNGFLKTALTCSQLQCKKMPFFWAILRCRGIIVLLLHEKLIFCVYISNIPSLDLSFWSEWSRLNKFYQRWWVKWGSLIYYSELVQSMCQSAHKCIWIFCFGSHEDYLSLNDVQVILRGVTQNPKYLKAPKIEPFSNRSYIEKKSLYELTTLRLATLVGKN